MKPFNDGIKNIIGMFAYEFYVVQQDFNKPCACVDFVTKQADPFCKKCLGTGYRVKIRKISGASQDSQGSFKNVGLEERTLATTYFIDGKYPISEENIIVDEGVPFVAHRLEQKKTSDKEIIYRKVYAVKKKTNSKAFMDNFNLAVKGERK